MLLFSERNTPRWIIFIFDLGICLFSIILAYLLRFNFVIDAIKKDATFPKAIFFVLAVRMITFLISKSYAGIIRYTSTKDAERIFLVTLIGSMFFALSNVVSFWIINKSYVVPFSIIIIDFMTTVFILAFYRMIVKVLFVEIRNPSSERKNVVIYGAGESGLITKRALERDFNSKQKVIAFIDDDKNKISKKLEGIQILSGQDLEKVFSENDVDNLIISIQKLSPERKKDIVDLALLHNVRVLNVPPVNKWINGELSFKQIKKIKIEDLLERDEIQLNYDLISQKLNNKIILISGAAGSIGSGMVRQIANFQPKLMILLDQAESPLYDLEMELNDISKNKNFEIVIGDIRNKERMRRLFEAFNPEIVFHAAAYKHVPMMENNPSEAIYTNIRGTKILADLSNEFNVEKFIMVSTDKAVNPTNVMGASKRIAEIYTQSLSKTSNTKFITTRFGNVLGSNGSVIPRFRKQIEQGGPITVTHAEITRFFMTIPEACQLVLEAGSMGNGGEIFIFDMGAPVKIVDLAKKMIKLSRLELGKDIQISFTGLRPGEKLYEELLNNQENTIPTHHPKIMIANVREYNFSEVSSKVDEIISLFNKQDNETIVIKMKELVPEFKSQNSIYQQLDK
ncbi:MAG: nucleoside-diphosphate sugar epimerase/dehydratase [Bacteroidota bacterium]